MKYKKYSYILILLIILTVSVFGCSKNEKNSANAQTSFNSFIHDIFVDEVQTDSITLNYSIAEPENYGIKDMIPTLGDYSLKSLEESLAVSENYLFSLKKFNYDKLTKDQQLTYDILQSFLELGMDSSDLLLYRESLSPTTGIQAQLPVLLAEYNFYGKDDIDEYIQLLSCVPDYFNQILVFEQQKSKAGLFMSDSSVDDILTQCNEFIADRENNYLIDVFNDKVSNFPGLTKEEIKSYQKSNKTAVLEQVLPAYETLISGLTQLKGTGTNENGLCGYPKGKEYYKYLVASSTGSSRSIEEINSLLDASVNTAALNMATIVKKDPEALNKVDIMSYPYTDPKEIISYLTTAIKKDFPSLDDVNCDVKYVHDSLEDSLSPAFYLTPPMDNYTENSIYINGGDSYDMSDIFTTLAHEGYPGHLYQTVYYNQQDPEPLRNLLNFSGYSEGWATYAELYSLHIAQLDDNVADLLENNMVVNLCMYAKIDIGVNYYGWDFKDISKFLANYGISDEDAIKRLQASMIEEPANYLKYTLGYLEFVALRDKAKKELGDAFDLKEFHKFLLDIGPAQFDIINNRLDDWIN
jgi:uncharacterized protein (DUF885 family)